MSIVAKYLNKSMVRRTDVLSAILVGNELTAIFKTSTNCLPCVKFVEHNIEFILMASSSLITLKVQIYLVGR